MHTTTTAAGHLRPQYRHKTETLAPAVSRADVEAVALAMVLAAGAVCGAVVALTTAIMRSALLRTAMMLCVVIAASYYGTCTFPICGLRVFAAPLLLALATDAQRIFASVLASGRDAILLCLQRSALAYKLLMRWYKPPQSGQREVSEDELSALLTFAPSSTPQD